MVKRGGAYGIVFKNVGAVILALANIKQKTNAK